MGENFKEAICKIYNRMSDVQSKEIFCNRLLYSLTDETSVIKAIVETTEEGKIWNEKIEYAKRCNKKICIFGAGILGVNHRLLSSVRYRMLC